MQVKRYVLLNSMLKFEGEEETSGKRMVIGRGEIRFKVRLSTLEMGRSPKP